MIRTEYYLLHIPRITAKSGGKLCVHPELLYTCRDVRFDNTIALIRLTNCLPLTMTVIIGQVTALFWITLIILQVSRSYTLSFSR